MTKETMAERITPDGQKLYEATKRFVSEFWESHNYDGNDALQELYLFSRLLAEVLASCPKALRKGATKVAVTDILDMTDFFVGEEVLEGELVDSDSLKKKTKRRRVDG